MSVLARPPARALVAVLALAAIWAVAFHATRLAFFPLIAAGGALTGLAGAWVRAADGARAGLARPLPSWRVSPAQVALAMVAAVVHLGLAHLLYAVGARLLPQLAPTAAEVYGRAGAIPLAWALVLGGLITAPLEEVFWRGGVHPLLVAAARRRWPRLTAVPGATVVLGAVAYAVFHAATGSAALVAAALLGGLVWGWLVERTGVLTVPVLAHALWALGMLVLPPL